MVSSDLMGGRVWIVVGDGIVVTRCQLNVLDAFAFGSLILLLCLVIVLAGHVGEEPAIRNLEAGCTAYISDRS